MTLPTLNQTFMFIDFTKGFDDKYLQTFVHELLDDLVRIYTAPHKGGIPLNEFLIGTMKIKDTQEAASRQNTMFSFLRRFNQPMPEGIMNIQVSFLQECHGIQLRFANSEYKDGNHDHFMMLRMNPVVLTGWVAVALRKAYGHDPQFDDDNKMMRAFLMIERCMLTIDLGVLFTGPTLQGRYIPRL